MSSAFQLNSQRQVSCFSPIIITHFTAPTPMCCLPRRNNQDEAQKALRSQVYVTANQLLVSHRPNKERVAILPARPRH
jgi:hypothetical protein